MSTFADYLATFDQAPGYLDWAAFGPLSTTVRAGAAIDLELLGSGRPSVLAEGAARAGRAQRLVAELLAVDADDVVLQPTSTHALQHALYGLTGAVIAGAGEFPSVSITLERAAAASRGQLVPRWITPADGRITTDTVAEALDADVTALVVSHVDFRTGYRADLAALRELIGPDRLLIVDAVQSLGVVDVDYGTADVVVGHAYKWMRAGRGTAFAAFGPSARERIAPLLSGRTGAIGDGLPLDALPGAAASARAFSVSGPDTLAAGRLATGVQDLLAAGVSRIEARLADNVDRILETADRHGIRVSSPRARHERAGIVTLAPGDVPRLSAALSAAGVVATTRGDAVRLAAHAGTDEATLELLDDALAASGNDTFISV